MSDPWERAETGEEGLPREYLVSAEVYVSTMASTSLRKPPTQRKKIDKRDSIKASSGPVDDGKKVKEKSSWISLSRTQTGAGHWRAATCKLLEEGDRCLLNIYVDESFLFQTVHVHLLNHTDIRQADRSLFFRDYCLSIYCVTEQRWSSNRPAEPVYLQFSNVDTSNTWLSLLRSYAIPEIYGRSFFPADGGAYRMWRQVELTLIQGRNLGNPKPFIESMNQTGIVGNAETFPDQETVDLDVSCEIRINKTLCGRSTVKKGIGSPDWHEAFTFSELPPFESLEVIVWREKKLFKPTAMGSVRIALANFSRGDAVEGWFPVLQPGPIASDIQVGDIRLKLRVDEEIILPHSAYSSLLQTFNKRNFLDWMTDLETKLRLKTVSPQLMLLAVAKNVLIDQVFELANREVDGSPSSHNTLFRGNTVLTKIMELSMSFYGKAFLEASIGNVMRRLCTEKVAIEVDPLRSGKSLKDIERNVEQLIYWCQEFWKQIYSVRTECPQEMRQLFEHIRKLVEKRYRVRGDPQDQNRELPWQSVSAFCFLRFIVPAILHPHLFGLCAGLPGVAVQRSLTLIAKVIQSLANLNATVQKEEFMRGVKEFLRDSLPAMIDYILVVSTPSSDPHAYAGSADDRHDRLNVINSLRERAASMPVLERESIPLLPHLLDIPRHIAIISSAVIRTVRDHQDPNDKRLNDLCNKCFKIEEYAVRRVSQLATRISMNRRPSLPAVLNGIDPHSTTPAVSASGRPQRSGSEKRTRKSLRPSSAPTSDSEIPNHRSPLFQRPLPVTPMFVPGTSRSGQNARSDTAGEQVSTSLDDGDRGRGAQEVPHSKKTSTDEVGGPVAGIMADPTQDPLAALLTEETPEDGLKNKKGILRGILARR